MFSIIAFIAVLMSGSVFAGVFFRKKFGETIPVSLMGIILILYICGLIGILKTGVVLILVVSFVLLFSSAISLVKDKRIKEYFRNYFGLSGLFFVLLYIVFLLLNHGRLAWYHDEVSHWMDCVKAMSGTDVLPANSEVSYALFPSYPPGMALFQYFFQKTHEIFDGTTTFCEWRSYVALQLFTVSIFFPALERIHYHKLVKPIFLGATVLSALILFPSYLATLLVDPVIGLMAGSGFVYLLSAVQQKLSEKALFIGLLGVCMTLIKDAGLYFAVFLAIIFCVLVLSEKRKKSLSFYLLASAPLAASLCTKGSWELVLKYYKPRLVFNGPVQIGEYLRLFFAGGDTTYKQETVDKFKQAFFVHNGLSIHSGVSISYFWILVILLAATGVISFLMIREKKRKYVLLGCALSLQTVLYIFFLGAVYISKFTVPEALELASYDRYVRIALLPHVIFLLWSVLYFCQSKKKTWKYSFTLFLSGMIVLLSPFESTKGFITRSTVQDSLRQREPYNEMQQTIEAECSGKEKIFYLSTTESGYEQNMYRLIARPNNITKFCSNPQEQIEGRQWIMDHILEKNDYVLMNDADETLNVLFEEFIAPNEKLQSKTLYRVNHEANLLEQIKTVH